MAQLKTALAATAVAALVAAGAYTQSSTQADTANVELGLHAWLKPDGK